MAYSQEVKEKALSLRMAGYSIKEIARELEIAQGTSSVWLRDVQLGKKAIRRLIKRKIYGQYKSREIAKNRKIKETNFYINDARNKLVKLELSKDLMILVCSTLFWAEGSKCKSYVAFTNSDPKMIALFVKLLRDSFNLDESKFRARIHIHNYHNEQRIVEFWSKVTNIPLNQFNKSYRKPNTQKRKRPGYNGCAVIRYYDYKIALQLNSFYNTFAEEIIGV